MARRGYNYVTESRRTARLYHPCYGWRHRHGARFFFDDKTWAIRYLVVDTGTWLPDRQVLISPIALGQPDWEGQFFPVKLTTEQVRNSPDIDTDKPVSRQQETRLHTYYDWPVYWSGGIPLGLMPPLRTQAGSS